MSTFPCIRSENVNKAMPALIGLQMLTIKYVIVTIDYN